VRPPAFDGCGYAYVCFQRRELGSYCFWVAFVCSARLPM